MDYEAYMKAGLLKKLKHCRPDRKKYRINPIFGFEVDRSNYLFSLLPTIVWCPWICRYNGFYVIDIWWLHLHIAFGKWEELSCRNCKHHEECINSKRINWYGDNIFERGEKCSDFESRF